ncbi:quinone oxidoreductase family protein [Sciscionella marina]|uniref:quinone oxidoreductase family protein n=1 Tax=Sciscionella marina TaxID=508770 RepID=UPI000475796B|nr:zinc-binding dehydrogenase [Sciscionella marina]
MRRVSFAEYGGPEVLRLEEAPVPEPGEGQLLVRVACAGLSAPVVRQLRGSPDGNGVDLPCAPGGDIAGTVVAVGDGVTGFAEGDRVAAVAFTGAYADYALSAESFSIALGAEVDFATGAALVRNGQVALGALRTAGIREGEAVAVTGAAGGVGHLAVQLAGLLGAGSVLGVTGDKAKAGFLRELGAAEVLDYAEFGAGEVADRVVDGVGGAVLGRSVAALRPFGTVVSYSAADGYVDATPLRMGMRCVRGFGMAPYVRADPERYAEHGRELLRLAASEALRPRTTGYPLAEAADAHRVLLDRAALGKVLLEIS